MQASRQEIGVLKKSNYCDVCVLGPPPNQFSRDLFLGRSISEYCGSAQRGCRACFAIHKFLSKRHHQQGDIDFVVNDASTNIIVESVSGKKYEFFSLEHAVKANLEQGSSSDRTLEEHPSILRMSEPSGCTSSVQCFDTLMHWISRCQVEHTTCNSITPKELPHRVLEILCIRPLRIRVVEGGTRRGKYACLSHRWGPKTKSTSLQTHNLSLYKAMIPSRKFYPLTRDAITMAFKLRIRYIWIDAYCILQDSKEDWEREAAKMGTIYENAFLTISATDSDNGRAIFSTSAPQSSHVTDVNGESIFIREQLNHPCEVEEDHMTDHLGSGITLSRAWIYQERLLSRRFVNFTRNETFWECRESTWCECGSRERWARLRKKQPRALQSQPWELVAKQYNTRELSYESDRLPALAGVASRFARIHGKTYLAGHWQEDLPTSLGWLKVSAAREPRPLHQTAPTWSWVSLPRGQRLWITTGRLHSHSIQLVGLNRKPPGADIYAGARQTEIIVEGHVLGVEIYKQRSLASNLFWSEDLVAKAGQALLAVQPDFDMDPKDPEKYQAVAGATSCVLLLLHHPGKKLFRLDVAGLLLLQRNDTDKATEEFERVGHFSKRDLDEYSHLDESGEFKDYCGNEPFPVEEDDRSPVTLEWLWDRAEKRQISCTYSDRPGSH